MSRLERDIIFGNRPIKATIDLLPSSFDGLSSIGDNTIIKEREILKGGTAVIVPVIHGDKIIALKIGNSANKYAVELAQAEGEVHSILSELTTNVPRYYGSWVENLRFENTIGSIKREVDAGFAIIAMEYFPQGSLGDKIYAHHKLDVPTTTALLKDPAKAMDTLHQEGMVHRDIKAENILLRNASNTQDEPLQGVLSDFDLVTMSGSLLVPEGTITTMSPELMRGSTEPEIDKYSLGAVAFNALTGEPAVPQVAQNADNIREFLEGTERKQYLHNMSSNLSPAIQTTLLKAISYDPSDRFAGDELISALIQASQEATEDSLRHNRTVIDVALGMSNPVDVFVRPDSLPPMRKK